jgi:hypothetical protein
VSKQYIGYTDVQEGYLGADTEILDPSMPDSYFVRLIVNGSANYISATPSKEVKPEWLKYLAMPIIVGRVGKQWYIIDIPDPKFEVHWLLQWRSSSALTLFDWPKTKTTNNDESA